MLIKDFEVKPDLMGLLEPQETGHHPYICISLNEKISLGAYKKSACLRDDYLACNGSLWSAVEGHRVRTWHL